MADETRPDAPETADAPRSNEPARLIECLECGETFAPRQHDAEFCCEPHRKLWNNRRAKYGPMFFDLVMAGRYDRTAEGAGEWRSLITRLAALVHEDDVNQRAGRRSFRKLTAVLKDKPVLRAKDFHLKPGRTAKPKE